MGSWTILPHASGSQSVRQAGCCLQHKAAMGAQTSVPCYPAFTPSAPCNKRASWPEGRNERGMPVHLSIDLAPLHPEQDNEKQHKVNRMRANFKRFWNQAQKCGSGLAAGEGQHVLLSSETTGGGWSIRRTEAVLSQCAWLRFPGSFSFRICHSFLLSPLHFILPFPTSFPTAIVRFSTAM